MKTDNYAPYWDAVSSICSYIITIYPGTVDYTASQDLEHERTNMPRKFSSLEAARIRCEAYNSANWN